MDGDAPATGVVLSMRSRGHLGVGRIPHSWIIIRIETER